jgi:hypothetical protein
MSLFKKILNQDKNPVQQDKSNASTAVVMLFNSLPKLDGTHIANVISQVETLKHPVAIDVQIEEKGILRAFVKFDDHKIQLVGFSAPVPSSTLERTIPTSNWKQEDKLPLQNHTAHVICYYEGENTNPTEQLISLYKIAHAFSNFGLLGILDEDAWNCMPTWMIKEQMKPDVLQSCRESVPLGIWTGFVKLFKSKNDVWYCTKGYHRFGVKDLAYLGQLGDANNVYTLFGNLFEYMLSGASIVAGNTAQISETEHIRFREVYEYDDYLNSPLQTLVLEKIKASEINKPVQ